MSRVRRQARGARQRDKQPCELFLGPVPVVPDVLHVARGLKSLATPLLLRPSALVGEIAQALDASVDLAQLRLR